MPFFAGNPVSEHGSDKGQNKRHFTLLSNIPPNNWMFVKNQNQN